MDEGILQPSMDKIRLERRSAFAMDVENPYFSVVIPTLMPSMSNLARCLRSVAEQIFSEWEIVIVDSPTAISDDVKRLAASFPRVRYLCDKGCRGVYPAMNLGLAETRGEWILFLGHDDRLNDCNVLMRVRSLIELNRYCFWRQGYYGNVLIQGDAGWAKNGEVYGGKFNLSSLLTRNICHQAIFYRGWNARRNAYGYSASYPVTADWDYNVRAWASGGFGYLPFVISVFQGGGVSSGMRFDGFTGSYALKLSYWRSRRPLVFALLTYLYCRIVANLFRAA